MTLGARLDGHIVQGHVDTTGICVDKRDENKEALADAFLTSNQSNNHSHALDFELTNASSDSIRILSGL